jgi:hypothetical protein
MAKHLSAWAGGISLGLLNVIMYFYLAKVWGTTPGFIALAKGLATVNIYVPLIFGMIIGSLIAAKLSKEFILRIPDAKTTARGFIGGLLMGIGLAMAPGCNIGNLVSGLASLGIAPILGSIGIVIGAFVAFKMFVKG